MPDRGLSPRVRGNQTQRLLAVALLGPIPARAGEPHARVQLFPERGAYPRACGGTLPHRRDGALARGLSPRVRGNRDFPLAPLSFWGPIPARAGEPEPPGIRTMGHRAYPRACGGTELVVLKNRRVQGLSPRVRGNLRGAMPVEPRLGPIPARAGEPSRSRYRRSAWRAYPRACGGTGILMIRRRISPGLSPRVRGNLFALHMNVTDRGPIPARAGEPVGCSW